MTEPPNENKPEEPKKQSLSERIDQIHEDIVIFGAILILVIVVVLIIINVTIGR